MSYARLFQGETPYTKGEDGTLTARTPYFKTQLDAIEQLVDGCVEISGEVGEKKIGDPLEKFNKGKVTEALYAVESWYSWHSREDYQNNIFSIRNALLCSRDGKFDHTENGVSILNYVAAKRAPPAHAEGVQGRECPRRCHQGHPPTVPQQHQ